MFKDGHRCSQMITHVHNCLQMYTYVQRCSQMVKDGQRWSQMFTDVQKCLQTITDVQRWSFFYLNVQVGTSTWLQHFLTLADLPEDEEELIQHRLHAEVCHIVT